MADSELALKRLLDSNDSTTQPNAHSQQLDLSTMKLCYLLENNRAIPGLVTTTDDIITPLAKSWIKVRYITSGETKEYEKDKVKVSCSVILFLYENCTMGLCRPVEIGRVVGPWPDQNFGHPACFSVELSLSRMRIQFNYRKYLPLLLLIYRFLLYFPSPYTYIHWQ